MSYVPTTKNVPFTSCFSTSTFHCSGYAIFDYTSKKPAVLGAARSVEMGLTAMVGAVVSWFVTEKLE